ncbi:hypothetical protein [Planctomicrobium sp. SH664]|uniref:hypothetical protein n=1 Tax=Planctomicrobium sp. SH664 TaxID=3448125 RepID=UPI003F5C173C
MLSALAGVLVGCQQSGPELSIVTGTVMLDGEPLPEALVTYQPLSGVGTYSSAFTDKNGFYRMRYSRDRDGVMMGRHSVSIATAPPSLGGVERVPPKYNSATELTQEINAPTHQFDYALETGNFKGKASWGR